MSRDLNRRVAELEDALLRGPRDEADAIALAESIAASMEAMDRATVANVEPERIDRTPILARIREVRGLPPLPLAGEAA